MKNVFYKTEFTKKSLWLTTVVILGIGAHSFAQPLPALPPLPDAKANSSSANSAIPPLPVLPPIIVDAKNVSSAENTKNVVSDSIPKDPVKKSSASVAGALAPLPDLAPVTQLSSDAPLDTPKPLSSGSGSTAALNAQTNILPPLADLPSLDSLSTEKPMRPKSTAATSLLKTTAGDKGNPTTENKDTATLGIPPLPGMLPLPGEVIDEKNMPALPAIPGLSANSTGAKKAKVADDKTKKSWEVTLESPAASEEIHFNYRRVLLPNAIYRTAYDNENEHLPLAVTRQDYEGLLFVSVMKNDVDATRALLNAGTDIRAVNGQGQSLLAAAHGAGANATERLLLARGAR